MTTKNRPQNRPSLLRRLSGSLTAIFAVAALLSTGLAITTATAADASTHHRHHRHHHHRHHFAKPTTYAVDHVECVPNGEDEWTIEVAWKVTGGRYANLGNPADRLSSPDNVRHGGARIVTTTESWGGWPGTGPDAATTSTFHYQQVVAPIQDANDSMKWRYLDGDETVTFTC